MHNLQQVLVNNTKDRPCPNKWQPSGLCTDFVHFPFLVLQADIVYIAFYRRKCPQWLPGVMVARDVKHASAMWEHDRCRRQLRYILSSWQQPSAISTCYFIIQTTDPFLQPVSLPWWAAILPISLLHSWHDWVYSASALIGVWHSFWLHSQVCVFCD